VQPSAMPADDRDSGAAQLLGNGGKIEPYTIIIMGHTKGPKTEEYNNTGPAFLV
jgi:hypothetical protein